MAKSQEEYKDMCEKFSLKGENHPMYGRKHTKEARHRTGIASSIRNKGKGNPMYGKTHTEETRKKISENKKGQGFGIPKSIETKKKMSEAVKLLTCPHCGKSARGSSMYRWHFDNCKLKV
jgi:hypothetical protein